MVPLPYFLLPSLLCGWCCIAGLSYLRKKGKNLRKVLILGAGRVGLQIDEFIRENRDLGYKVIGFLDDNHVNSAISHQIIGKLHELERVINDRNFDEIMIALPITKEKKIRDAIEMADQYGVRIRMVPDYFRILGRNYTVRKFGDLPVINIREIPLDDLVNNILKRIFDVVFSLLVMLLISPVYFLIQLLIKLDSRGPVFYTPIRVGRGGTDVQIV